MIFFFSFFRCLEVSYIGYGPIHDILETWAINGRSSIVRALFWFPFSELTIMSYMNEASQRPQLVSLSEWIFCKEDFVGLKPSSSKLDVVLKCIAWPHWWSFEDKDQMAVDSCLIISCIFCFSSIFLFLPFNQAVKKFGIILENNEIIKKWQW